MDRQKENMVLKGMSSVHSGLGILLGVGRISASTHDQILALLNDDENESNASAGTKNDVARPKNLERADLRPKPYKPRHLRPDPAISLTDLQQGMSNMTVNDRSYTTLKKSSDTWPNQSDGTSQPTNGDTWPDSRRSNIVCPWFLTPGYRCREQEKGQCAWAHEDVPDGTKDPLICSFWAEDRCVKSDDQCRFAHYWAQHRQIAPVPGTKSKKGPKKTSSVDVAW
ncbi:hypothetical protein PG996_007863 [Apiospora saccharicola]|uniref:C3H1-type domain-containing protein n=1 Tax=Apiospora saccharicola TaxID=335842 RepID=A0ABR1UWA6_9PEZI